MDDSFTILIIESLGNDVTILRTALKRAGIHNPIQVVEDGQQAIDYLCGAGVYRDRRQYPFPKVIFSDLNMPRMDGFQVLEWLRNHPECSVIPLIILTNSKRDEDIKRAYQLGANAYFVKPNRLEELQEMVKTLFNFWSWCEIPYVPAHC